MAYNINDIDKILSFKTWTEKQKIDALLKLDCFMYTCLGTDSLKKEREEVHRNSKKIYQAIKTINPEEAKILLR
jgi:hypothetical protein|tara:strand:- start:19558 stop:19779 length:222 start_codon:yes stop_codon:yes gene_type:complete